MWLELLAPQGGSLSTFNPSPLLCSLLGGQVPNWSLPFSSYSILCGFFLLHWFHNSLSAGLQFVFSEKFSTCRGGFNVFMVGGELCVLLLHHPHLNLHSSLFGWVPFGTLCRMLNWSLVWMSDHSHSLGRIPIRFILFTWTCMRVLIKHLCSALFFSEQWGGQTPKVVAQFLLQSSFHPT